MEAMQTLLSGREETSDQAGFTLIELMVVITILAAIVLIVLPSFIGQSDKAHQVAAKTDLTSTFRSVKAVWQQNDQSLPLTQGELVAELADGEPAYTIQEGSSYDPGAISVAFTTPRTITLRTEADNGDRLAVHSVLGFNTRRLMNPDPAAPPIMNEIISPSFEDGMTGWQISGAQTPVSSKATSGQRIFRLVAQADAPVAGPWHTHIPVAPQTTYTAAADILRCDAPNGCRVSIEWHGDSGRISTARSPLMKSGRAKITSDAPPGTVTAVVTLYGVEPLAGDVMEWDSATMVTGDNSGSYFDGSFPEGQWNGMPNRSTSTAPAWRLWEPAR